MEERLKIKVCGMRYADNICEVSGLPVDYMGFIFYDRSPRCCRGIDPGILGSLPESVTPVMVSVDMPEEELLQLASLFGFGTLQLHGGESPEMCRRLRERGFKVWKAIAAKSAESIRSAEDYAEAADMFVFDTASPKQGGTGQKFDWDILNNYRLPVPFMLSGGIGPEDAAAVKVFSHPKLVGVDLNSRFEVQPGRKDSDRLARFVSSLRK